VQINKIVLHLTPALVRSLRVAVAPAMAADRLAQEALAAMKYDLAFSSGRAVHGIASSDAQTISLSLRAKMWPFA